MSTERLRPTIEFTAAAVARVKYWVAEENNQALKLRVYITGGGCSGFQYVFTFDEQVHEGDMLVNTQGALLVVDRVSLQYLNGATVDYEEDLRGLRFIVNNPKAKTTCGCGSSFTL